jgi:putative ABC transport system permease protein
MLTRFLNHLRQRRMNEEIRQELEAHRAEIEEAELARGAPPEEARRRAALRFGSSASYVEQTRDADLITWLDDAWRDWKYAARQLLRNPGFAASAILLLALGIGVNGAIFTVVNSVILRPLALREPERVLSVSESTGRFGTPTSWPDFQDLRNGNHVFESTGGFMRSTLVVHSASEARNVKGASATPGYFAALGVQPVAGRIFGDAEATAGAAPVALVREDFWRSALNSDPEILGHTVLVNGEATQVVGILPAEFRFPNSDTVVWTPLIPRGPQLNRGYHAINMVGRLKPGATISAALAELQLIMKRLEQQYPEQNRGRGARVALLQDASLDKDLRDRLFLLQIAALTLFLMAFANVSGLLLARYSARRGELDIRLALGASRTRQFRQHITETLLLTGIGAVISIGVVAAGVRFLTWLYGEQMPRAAEIGPDWRLVAAVIALSILGALAMGAATSLHEWRRSSGISAGAGTRSSADRRGVRVRKVLVVMQLACAVVVLAATGAVLHSFWTLLHVDLGFDQSHLVTARINLPAGKYKTGAAIGERFERVAADLSAIPGVKQAAAINLLPVAEWGFNGSVNVEGMSEHHGFFAEYKWVTKDYLRTMGIPLLRGRQFSPEEMAGRQKAAIINETMVRQLWGGKDPIGAHINIFSPEWITVIGVARDIRQSGVDVPPSAEVFLPAEGFVAPMPSWSVILRSDLPLTSLLPGIRSVVHGEEAEAAIDRVQTMDEAVAKTISAERIVAFLLICFACLALVVASLGLYSLMAFTITARLPELAIRSALGSTPRGLIGLTEREGLALVASGLAVGLGAAWLVRPLLAAYVVNAGEMNIAVAAVTGLVLFAVGAVAVSVPSLRVLRIDPVSILRRE